jgi:cell division protein FtsL
MMLCDSFVARDAPSPIFLTIEYLWVVQVVRLWMLTVIVMVAVMVAAISKKKKKMFQYLEQVVAVRIMFIFV